MLPISANARLVRTDNDLFITDKKWSDSVKEIDWMWIASIGTREIINKGYNLSNPLSIDQGWLSPPYDYPCIMITLSKSPNTECPDEYPIFETGVAACFKFPDGKELFSITGFETICFPPVPRN